MPALLESVSPVDAITHMLNRYGIIKAVSNFKMTGLASFKVVGGAGCAAFTGVSRLLTFGSRAAGRFSANEVSRDERGHAKAVPALLTPLALVNPQSSLNN